MSKLICCSADDVCEAAIEKILSLNIENAAEGKDEVSLQSKPWRVGFKLVETNQLP